MIDLGPILSLLSNLLPSLLLAWLIGIPLGLLLQQDHRIRGLLSPLLWIVLFISIALIPIFEPAPAGLSRLGQALISRPLWLPLGLLTALFGDRNRIGFTLRTSLVMGWLLSLGPAIAGEAMANAVDRLALGPNLANWLTYGLVGLALDRAILGVVDRLPQPEKEPPPEIDLSPQAHWVWTGAGIALALIGLELIGRLTDGPQPSQALIDLLHGLGSRAAGGFEFIVVTRKQEWLGALAGMLVAAAGLALGLRALRTYPHSHPAAKVLKLLAGFGLFAGAVSIALPAGLFAQIGPFFLSQLLTLLIPLGAYLIHLSDQSPGDLTRGSLLLAWILVGGWLPLLGWSTIGDRMYILTAFLNGEGLPGVLLGQALISTLLGGLLWLHRDRWLRSTS